MLKRSNKSRKTAYQLRRLPSGRHRPSSLNRFSRGRTSHIFALGIIVWLLILSRLFFIQVIKGTEYKKIATKQHQQHIKLEAKRGIIYDRNGKALVINLPVESFFAIPESVKNPDQVAKAFSSSGLGNDQIKRRLKERKRFVWLKRKVEVKESERIKRRRLEGVWTIDETKRYHLYGDLAEEVLGFTDIDNRGLAGVEYQYDRYLAGKDGKAIFQRDGHRNSYKIAEYPLQKPEDGKNLVLTIDVELQSIVEEELKRGIERTEADGGGAIFMNPKTGEILAMAYCNKQEGLPIRNKIISDNFEPGSTFKIITAACALEEKVLEPQDSIFAENGEFRIGQRTIHDVKAYGWLTFKESVIYSSNIALSKIAMMVGPEKLYRYITDFGIGEKTGIDLPGEARGFIPSPKRWSDFVLSCIAFGQGISLTPLQLVCAYSAIANDGILMRPFVVKAILDTNKDTLKLESPTPVRRVISKRTAHLLIDFMKGVVSFGTGRKAKMEGLSIGGKTGTAQKAKPGKRGYQKGSVIASFVGFFPAEDPQLVGLIILDSPKKEHLGGLTAAPVFKRTTQRIVSLTADRLLVTSSGSVVSTASREIDSDVTSKRLYQEDLQAFDLFSVPDPSPEEELLMPDVRGMTIREAVRVLVREGLQFDLQGSGMVVRQTPEPNSRVNRDTRCIIRCQP